MDICIRPGDVKKTPGLQQKKDGGLNTTGLLDENLFSPERPGATDTGKFAITRTMNTIRQHYEPGGKHYPHKHDDAEQIYYLESGTARVRVGDETFDIEAGSVVYIAPGTEHEFENIGSEPCVNLLISVALKSA